VVANHKQIRVAGSPPTSVGEDSKITTEAPMIESNDNGHQPPERSHGSGLPMNAEAAANYLGEGVKIVQKKTREGKIVGFTADDGPRRHWYYYISDLDDYRHKHCSRPRKPKSNDDAKLPG
jgi:hypothetical protein